MLSLLLALLAGLGPLASEAPASAPGDRAGPVALVAQTFPFDAALAARLHPDAERPRVILTLDGADAPDPLAARAASVQRGSVADAATDARRDREIADLLHGAGSVELLGGTWIGWCTAGLDARRERRWTRALREAHARGVPVVATGGAAAWVARWCLQPREVVGRPAQVPHDATRDVLVEGLGLVDGPLVAVLAPQEPSWDRVLERAVAHGFGDVLLLEGAVAWLDVPARVEAEVHGPGAAVWIHLGGATRSREVVRGARVALLTDGAVWSERDAADRVAAPAEVAPPGAAVVAGATVVAPLALRAALAAAAPAEPRDAPADARLWVEDVRLARDARTSRGPGAWRGLVLDVRLARRDRP